MTNKNKNKKINPHGKKERGRTGLKECYSVAFALILTGYILRIVPSFLDTAWYGAAGWICVYVASCILAYYSHLLGNRYGVSYMVVGAAGITFALLLSEVDVQSYLQKWDLSLLSGIDIKTVVVELFTLAFLICGSFGIVLGIWGFLQNIFEQKRLQRKLFQMVKRQHEEADDVEMNIEIKEISEYLGLLFVILQIVYFLIERNA